MHSIVNHHIINGLQKMAIYETKMRFYLIGSNSVQTSFRVLKIDRTEPKNLVIIDDKVEYTQCEIKNLLEMIKEGNRTHFDSRHSPGLTRTVSAFGILGFVRFLEGYYMILVTKRRKIALIGLHTIYKVEDTAMIYIPNEPVSKSNDKEFKYLRLFQNVDLSSNFYFSYSYDLTNTLQYNMAAVLSHPLTKCNSNISSHVTELSRREAKYFHSHSSYAGSLKNEGSCTSSEGDNLVEFAVHAVPNKKFIWNSYLLEPVQALVHPSWIISIIHGFIAQSNLSVYGRSIFVTLIARRSCKYAGTRFLKRGANFEGDVANEVETEQLVYDAHVSSFHRGKFTSYVQYRGSIPAHWSQDTSKMVPKPPIQFDIVEPFAETAGKHFNQLLRRFGSPIIVLNLVKRRERRPHEAVLSAEYARLVQQLNITLPPQHQIHYVALDMARISKEKEENVMSRLSSFAYKAIKKTGIFQSFPPYYGPDLHYRSLEKITTHENKTRVFSDGEPAQDPCHKQTGIVRVNCVDCLDRTNTAQFCLGKCALAFQLYVLGILKKPSLEFDSDCVRMLEEMYEDHGDTLALQYGGSQLVHRIKTYRRTAPWTSQGNDIMQSLSRYYSNTFSDTDKQSAINLFLGVFRPFLEQIPIWDLPSDAYLHSGISRGLLPCHRSICLLTTTSQMNLPSCRNSFLIT